MGDFENNVILVALAKARLKRDPEYYNDELRRLITSEDQALSLRATMQQDMYEFAMENPGKPIPISMEEVAESLEEYKEYTYEN